MKINHDELRKFILNLSGTIELPHFEKTSFRINKKIFVTWIENGDIICLLLSKKEQSVFCSIDPTNIFPVPNKWGENGATYFKFKDVHLSILKDAIQVAYEEKSTK